MAATQHQLSYRLASGDWTRRVPARDRDQKRYVSGHRLPVRADSRQPSSEKTRSGLLKKLAAAGTLVYTPLLAEPSRAVTAEDVADTFNKVEGFSNQVTSTVSSTYNALSEVLQQVYTFVKPAVDVTVPLVQKTSDVAIKAAAPVASDVASQAVKALQNVGVDTKPVLEAGQTAVTVVGKAAEQTSTLIQSAKPAASTTLESLLTSDPLILTGEVGALVLLYVLAPGILSALGDAARGYRGDLTAPQALDFVSNKNYILVDVRTEKEKSRSGIPSPPNKAKKNFISMPIEEFSSKLRSQLRNPRGVEAEVAAIKISALKRVNKGTNIVILDSVGNIAKTVAKSLSGLGFKNAWTVADGFDGSKGWVQNRLGKESYYSSFAEVLSPSKVIPAATSKLFKTTVGSTSSSVVDVAPRSNKLLPSGE